MVPITQFDLNDAIVFRIRQIVKYKGWTLNELVRRSGLRQSTLSEIMTGKSVNPRLVTLKKIIRGFGMSPAEFFDHEIFDQLYGDAVEGVEEEELTRRTHRNKQ